MNDKKTRFKQLADELRYLSELVPSTKEELAEWNKLARDIEANLLLGPTGVSEYIPEFLWHYLADADIRMKDKQYADLQNRGIRELIQQLSSGVMPLE